VCSLGPHRPPSFSQPNHIALVIVHPPTMARCPADLGRFLGRGTRSDLGKDASTRASASPDAGLGSLDGRVDTLTAELERSLKEVSGMGCMCGYRVVSMLAPSSSPSRPPRRCYRASANCPREPVCRPMLFSTRLCTPLGMAVRMLICVIQPLQP
jgi:hypothetical protein